MMKFFDKSKAGKLALGLSVALAFVGFSFAGVASAQTMTPEQLFQALLQLGPSGMEQLQAMIAGNTGSTGGSMMTTGCNFTRDLTMGSTGDDVKCLQQWLNSHGYTVATTGAGSMGNESTYFGPATQAALSRFQTTAGVSPAAGYFGPLTRAALASMTGPVAPGIPGGTPTPGLPTGCTSTSGFSAITGQSCAGGSTLPAGCMPGYAFSVTTGMSCTGGSSSSSTGSTNLSGGSGSIENADYVSGLNNEKVGEDEDDVDVAGLDIEADAGSDLEITAVRLNFTKSTGASHDFRKYAKDVSIWVDDEEFARVDGDAFTSDNSYDKTISLDSGAIIKSGDTGRLVVKVSGISNLDSTDAGDAWTLEFETVRFRDASGGVISDTSTGDINDDTGRTFTFDTFATSAGTELKAVLSSNTPDDGVVAVDATNDTNDVELLRFTLEAKGSDILIKDLPITFATTSGGTATSLSSIVKTAYLVIDGEEFSENPSGSAIAVGPSGTTVTFDDIDFTISKGDKVEVVVKADINDIDSDFAEGDQLTVSYTTSNRESADVEDETGEDLVSGDRTGTATGKAQEFRSQGIFLTLVSTTAESNLNDAADTGTFKIKYKVTAVGNTIYVSSLATSVGLTYSVDRAGTATTAGSISGTIVNETDTDLTSVGNYQIEEDTSETFVLTVTVPNGTGGAADQYRTSLTGVKWDTDDDATPDSNYTSNLDAFKTPYVYLDAA